MIILLELIMINTLKLDWKNCFGIKELNHEFSFSLGTPIQLIYAPNGSMKTSFAKTMRYLSGQSKEIPRDQLHDDDESSFSLEVDGSPVPKDNLQTPGLQRLKLSLYSRNVHNRQFRNMLFYTTATRRKLWQIRI